MYGGRSELEIFLKQSEESFSGFLCVCVCVGELYKGSVQSSARANLWTSLPPSLLTSLFLLLHIPLERMTEEGAELSVHLLNLSAGKFHRLRRETDRETEKQEL